MIPKSIYSSKKPTEFIFRFKFDSKFIHN